MLKSFVPPGITCFNLGNGSSVKDVIETARRVTKAEIKVKEVARREGDPDRLIGSSEKAIKKLKWSPAHAALENIIESAWLWHKKINGIN